MKHGIERIAMKQFRRSSPPPTQSCLVEGADASEEFFIYRGYNYWEDLCIVNRDSKEKIESVVLYDFATPDLIGTVIRIDDTSVRLCSYIRNEGGNLRGRKIFLIGKRRG